MVEHVTDDWRNATIDYRTLIAEGRLPGYRTVVKFAVSTNVDTGQFQILSNNQAIVHFIASAQQMTVRCASANDHSAGSGARKIALTYLNDDAEELTEIITLEADQATNTVATDIYRIMSMTTIEYGTDAQGISGAAGEITLTNLTNTETYAQIDQYNCCSENLIHWIAPGQMVIPVMIEIQCIEQGDGVEMALFATYDHTAIGGGDCVLTQTGVCDLAWGNTSVILSDPSPKVYNGSDTIQAIGYMARSITLDNIRAGGSLVVYEYTPDYME